MGITLQTWPKPPFPRVSSSSKSVRYRELTVMGVSQMPVATGEEERGVLVGDICFTGSSFSVLTISGFN
jgi:hypothetical protein